MFLARRRAFARHPLCRVLEKKKREREEGNGREVAKRREREKKEKKKKKKKNRKKHKQINFEQKNILSLYVNRVGKR